MSKVEAQCCYNKMLYYFNGDTEKTWNWFKSPNACLGNVSPIDMIRTGRTNKLLKYIESCEKGYFP